MQRFKDIALRALSMILCTALGAVLAVNLTIMVEGMLDPDSLPSVFGVISLVTLSGSMSGELDDSIETGDLILLSSGGFEDLEAGDIITYKLDGSYITHRIIEKTADEQNNTAFLVKGDANEQPDDTLVTEQNYIGRLTHIIPGAGDLVLFTQTPAGIFFFAGLPLSILLLISWSQKRKEKKQILQEMEEAKQKAAALEQQLADQSRHPLSQSEGL